MNHFANRAFSTFSLALYLGLFVLVAKFSFQSSQSISISLPSTALFSPRPPQMDWMNAMVPLKIEKENLASADNFKIKEIKTIKHAKIELTAAKTIVMKPELIVAKPIETEEKFTWKSVTGQKELPVETIKNYLTQVEFSYPSIQYLALYQDFSIKEEVVVAKENTRAPAETAKPFEDKVSTTLSSNMTVEDDLVLYDYQDDEVKETSKVESLVVEDSKPVKEVIKSSPTNIVEKTEFKKENKVEEVAIGDLLTFDYSQAQASAPKVSAATVPAKEVKKAAPQAAKNNEYSSALTSDQTVDQKEDASEGFVSKGKALPIRSSVVISAASADGKDFTDHKGFDVQFKDDANDFVQDLDNGQVAFDYSLNESVSVRSAKIIARNHVTTHMDFVLEQNSTPELVPLLTEEYFKKLQFNNAVTGGLLVKVDSSVAEVEIDKSFSKKIYLDSSLVETKSPYFEYIYFANVPAGNVMMNFVTKNKEMRKILHVVDGELTFEKNIIEEVGQAKIVMYEDNLLSKEKIALNINAEKVTEFTQDPRAEKLSLNTYNLAVGSLSYGSRLYLELAHQSEPIFVGMGDNRKVNIPSEDYIRLILKNFPEGKLNTRCMVQVNLSKKAVEVFHQAEGVEDALMTSSQMVDKDGSFHNSLSGKTEKVFIQGEYQGNSKADPNGVIHIKIKYVDGTSDYLKTFCSPNTYLVEQL